MTIKANRYNWDRVNFLQKNPIIFKMSTRKFLLVAEFSTRNWDIPTRTLLVLYSKFWALFGTQLIYKFIALMPCMFAVTLDCYNSIFFFGYFGTEYFFFGWRFEVEIPTCPLKDSIQQYISLLKYEY
jgi:hypothetical protein